MNIPLNIDWQQILLHFFNFSILVGGLYLLLFKPVKDFMAKREQHYQAIDDDAAAKLREAEEKVRSADERVAALDNELTAQRESAAKEASALAERQRANAKAEADHLAHDRWVVAFEGDSRAKSQFGALRQAKVADVARAREHNEAAVLHLGQRNRLAEPVGQGVVRCDVALFASRSLAFS